MNKTHYERRSHEQGNYEIIPTYPGLVVVTIKSLATGQTMKVYLDEPTQTVNEEGTNVTTYTGHFYEEKFMATMSEGIEYTGLPLMYPYPDLPGKGSEILVIDTENHYFSIKNTGITNSQNILQFGNIQFGMQDILSSRFGESETRPIPENAVTYKFTRFVPESDDTIDPTIPPGDVVVTPGGGSESELGPTQN